MKGTLLNSLKTGLESFFKSPLFWVAGTGIFTLLLLRSFTPTDEEAGEWQVYFLFPVFLFLFLLIIYKNHSFLVSTLKGLLIILFLVLELHLYYHPMVVLLAIGSFPIVYFINKKVSGDLNKYSDKGLVLPAYFIYTISFLLSIKLCYWDKFDFYLLRDHSIIVICIAFILGLLSYFNFNFKYHPFVLRLFKLKFFLPIILFGIFSLRAVPMGWGELHHWGCYVGPAEMVRQGGYLLWNVPSQYGFLSVLSIAMLPFDSCWQSFYVLQAIFLIVSSLILFWVIYSSNKNVFNFAFAITVALVSVFMIPGYLPNLAGASSFPSVGPYRFLWVQILLFFLVVQYKRKFFNQKWEIIIGSFIWMLSALWAFEVAYYVSFPWFGYLFIKSIRFNENNKVDYKKSIIKCIAFFLIPVSFFLLSLMLIVSFYFIKINRLPDWLSFYEHAISFKEGFESFLINIEGGIGVILLILFFIATFFYERCRDFKKYQDYLAILLACMLSVYTTITYFIGRSHENNILNIMPVIVLVIAIVYLLNRSIDVSYTQVLYKYFIFPFYLVLIVLAIGNSPSILKAYFSGVMSGYSDIQKLTPPNSLSLDLLLISAGITEKDSVAYLSDEMLMNYQQNKKPFTHFKHWLPMNPMTTTNPLDGKRVEVYMKRFSDQFKTGGYLIKNKRHGFEIEKFICNDYDSVGPFFENDDWKVMRYVRKGSKLKERRKIEVLEENLFKINFDSTELPGLHKVMTSEKVFSGSHSYLIKEAVILSQEILFKIPEHKYDQIVNCNIIKIQTSIFASDTSGKLFMVLDFQDKDGQNLYWSNYKMKQRLSSKQWHSQEFLFLSPKHLDQEGRMKIYFTKSDTMTRFYIDNISISSIKILSK